VIQLLVWLSAFNVLSYRSDQQVFCLGFLLFLCSSICLDCIASKSRKQKQASPLSSLKIPSHNLLRALLVSHFENSEGVCETFLNLFG